MTRIYQESRVSSPNCWRAWWRRGGRGALVRMRRGHGVAAVVVVVAMCTLFIACGGSRGEEAAALLPDLEISEVSLDAAAEWQGLLNSPKDYAGAIVVGFADDSGVRYADGAWRNNGEPVEALSDFRTRFPTVLPRRVITELDEATIDQARATAAAKGVTLPNFNGWYRLPATDPVVAEALLAYLFDQPSVAWAHPAPIPKPADTTPFPTFPSGGPGQDYLVATNGGLNITTAWDRGLTGVGQVIFDVEGSWNYTHIDLPPVTPVSATVYTDYKDAAEAQASKDHGTAVLGILAGKPNMYGVTGIAHGATVRTATDGISAGSTIGMLTQLLKDLTLGMEPEGRVVIIELQFPGPNGTDPTSVPPDAAGETNCPGCLPLEAYAMEAGSIKSMVDAGVLVFEAAGNGAVSLDDPTAQAKQCGNQTCPNLATADTGAVLVGASTGPSLAKHPASNCGARVNAFAWGANVVSAGYGDYAAISTAGDENAAYTKQFGGTSAATAIYGGIGALLQEYVQQLYTGQVTVHPLTGAPATPGAPVLANPLQDWQKAYLSSADFRKLLTYTAPGQGTPYAAVPQTAGTCHIGGQLDVGKALEVLFTGGVLPTIVLDAEYCEFSANPTCLQACTANPLDPQAGCDRLCVHQPASSLCAQWCYTVETNDLWDEWALFASKDTTCGHVFLDPKKLDVDGDGRGDLIAVDLESTPAKWYVDRSGANITDSEDGFGAWDLIVDFEAPSAPPGTPNRIFPVVADYNRDGRSDLALYHSDTGHWVIKYTEPNWVIPPLLFADLGTWDVALDLAAANPGVWQAGSRPFAQYTSLTQQLVAADTYAGHRVVWPLELRLWTPDGHALIAEGNNPTLTFDPQFLFQPAILTPAFLQAAPGWSYLTPNGEDFIIPQGVANAGAYYAVTNYNATTSWLFLLTESGATVFDPAGSPAMQVIHGHFGPGIYRSRRTPDTGEWFFIPDLEFVPDPTLLPITDFGGRECHPAVADYDGDTWDDRAVLCPNGEWRIAYSTKPGSPLHELYLGNPIVQGLPGVHHPTSVPLETLQSILAPLLTVPGCETAENEALCQLIQMTAAGYPVPTGPHFAPCVSTPGNNPVDCLAQ